MTYLVIVERNEQRLPLRCGTLEAVAALTADVPAARRAVFAVGARIGARPLDARERVELRLADQAVAS